jgi:ATP-binding cassette subfamily F protein 3
MREALAFALQDYAGALVLISHDRALLETCVDEYLLVADGGIRLWEEDLDGYAKLLREASTTAKTPSAKALIVTDKVATAHTTAQEPAVPAVTAREMPEDARLKRQQAAQKREQLRPLKKQLEQLEKQLKECTLHLEEIEQKLTDETLYQSEKKQELQKLLAARTVSQKQQKDIEEALLSAMEHLELLERKVTGC